MIWCHISMLESHVDEYHEPYRTALKCLVNDYKAAEGNAEQQIKIIDKFAEKYTVISYIWYLYYGLHRFKGVEEDVLKRRNEIKLKNLCHLFQHFWFSTYKLEEDDGTFFLKLLTKHYSAIDVREWNEKTILEKLKFLERIKKCLLFPNHSLEEFYKEYIKFTPDTEEELEKLKTHFQISTDLFKKIRFKEDDEWWTNVKKTNDDLMLCTYSRYCRFFIFDKEMFETYIKEIENASKLSLENVKKWQLDAIKFEKDFNSIEATILLLKKFFGDEETYQINEINFDEILNQMLFEVPKEPPAVLNFVVRDNEIKLVRKSQKVVFKSPKFKQHILPLTIINYILKKLKPNLLEKLYKTSKYFYTLFEINLCSTLDISDQYPSSVTYKNGLFYSGNDPREIKKIFLTSKLFVNDKNSSALPSMIPKIFKSQISAMYLFHQNLTTKELIFLGSNVSQLLFNDTKIIKENKETCCVPEIIEKLPNLKVAEFYELQYPAFPFVKEHVNCSNELERFVIKTFLEPIDINFLSEFLKGNAISPSADIFIKNSFTESEYKDIEEMLYVCLDFWKSQKLERWVRLRIPGVRGGDYSI